MVAKILVTGISGRRWCWEGWGIKGDRMGFNRMGMRS